jgi:hypothetical protein
MRTRLVRDLQPTTQYVHSILCNCDGRYIGETYRPLTMRLSEHGNSFKEDLLEKSKLAQQVYEDGYRVSCDEAKILKVESRSRF